MKRDFYRLILLFSVLAAGVFSVKAQALRAEAKLDKTSIPLGDQTVLHLIVHVPAGEEVSFPPLSDTISSKVQVVEVGKADTSDDKNAPGGKIITEHFTISSFEPGTYTIPSFQFKGKKAAAETNTLIFQVLPVKVDTTKAIYDIKQPLTVSYTFLDWLRDHWLWFAIPLAVILLCWALFGYLKKRPKQELTAEPVRTAEPPYVIAVKKLQALQEKKLWQQGEVKQYHSEISEILREYLEQNYRISALEQTTADILVSLRSAPITGDSLALLSRILTLSDLVKFAKEKPLPAGNEQSMSDALNFVRVTGEIAATSVQQDGAEEKGGKL